MTQEPVAWMSQGGDVSRSVKYFEEMGFKKPYIPLYTSPQQHTAAVPDGWKLVPIEPTEAKGEDAKRIDWLEANPGFELKKYITWRNGEDEYDGVERTYWQLTDNDDTEFKGTTLRDAMDAARAAEGEIK